MKVEGRCGRMRMAAYCRVSTEKEEQLSSLENQREFFEQYADKEGDTLVKYTLMRVSAEKA